MNLSIDHLPLRHHDFIELWEKYTFLATIPFSQFLTIIITILSHKPPLEPVGKLWGKFQHSQQHGSYEEESEGTDESSVSTG